MLPLYWHQAMAMPSLSALSDPPERLTPETNPNLAKPILVASGLTKQFHGFVVVKNANLSVRTGSIHALIGPNGAGKTTMFNLLTGFITPTQGKIEFEGVNITNISAEAVARRGLVRSFQISSVFAKLSVHENVRVALQRQAGLAHQFWRSDSALRQLDERVEQLLEAVNLTRYRDTLATHLSYGRKRILELATTLALEPKLLLLDEPMAGLAHEDIDRVAELIQKVSQGRTVLMVEHNLSVVRSLCDAITVLQRGSVIAEGRYDEVSENPLVREAYIGTEEEN
ncbi:ABC transporter ATP-binding protein [Advenella mimigardefordensis]|uniref:Putative high-affinity branched-chain amino acid transport ATP-binding protein BraF n=1 Tax=Advenella mimigardefordensis (strain DSM 17166 / LMG 22922 / DPN7) TaxID=1247726 RepID=W0PBB0_ADVMD|nr:putative high-affinity branched-chain amino acid transport ATP-binding protein BraF [Advenella mimigardefordensis DPN7]